MTDNTNGKIEPTNVACTKIVDADGNPIDGTKPESTPTFTNIYSTSLPLSGMSGVTLTYLAGAAVLCAAAAGCTFVARRMRREASVVNKKVCSFPILFALLALLIGACAVVFPASAQAAPTSTGSITVSGTVARSYDATRSLAPTSSTATATPRSPPTSLGKRRRA